MKYRVAWHPDAFRRLRRTWLAANQPDAGIQAFDEVEQTLSRDAHLLGESREKKRRILIIPPIGVVFRAKADTGEVLILDAWMIAKRKQ